MDPVQGNESRRSVIKLQQSVEKKEFLTVDNLNVMSGENGNASKKSSITSPKIIINEIPQDLMANYNSSQGFNFKKFFCPSKECCSFIFSSFCILILLSIILLTLSLFKLIISTSQLIEYQNSQNVYTLDPMSKSGESKNVKSQVQTTTTRRPQVTTRRRGTGKQSRTDIRTTKPPITTSTTRKPENKGKGKSESTEMTYEPVSVIYSKIISSFFFTCVSFVSLSSLILSQRFPNFSAKCYNYLSSIYLISTVIITIIILLNVTLIILTVSEEDKNIDVTTLIQLTGTLILFTCIFTVNQLVWIQHLEQNVTWNKRIFASQDLSIC